MDEISIEGSQLLICRTGYTGEDGFELFCPAGDAARWWKAFLEAEVKPCGLGARDSLRLEMCYPLNGQDLTPCRTPIEAGLGFCVKMDKPDFIGKAALIKQKESGLKRKLVMFSIGDPEPLVYHDEPIYRDGELVSENTHGAYSHVNGCSIGMCWLKNPDGIDDEWIMAGTYEINVAGKMFPIKIHLEPIYDPKSKRVRM